MAALLVGLLLDDVRDLSYEIRGPNLFPQILGAMGLPWERVLSVTVPVPGTAAHVISKRPPLVRNHRVTRSFLLLLLEFNVSARYAPGCMLCPPWGCLWTCGETQQRWGEVTVGLAVHKRVTDECNTAPSRGLCLGRGREE